MSLFLVKYRGCLREYLIFLRINVFALSEWHFGFQSYYFIQIFMRHHPLVSFLPLLSASFLGANTPLAWTQFVADSEAGRASALPDYSYAGYKYGTEAIPDVTWKTFDVTDYGALPNDELSDYAGIQRAIRAAEANGSGVVFFPPGKFLVAEGPGVSTPIEINAPNIVLRGSGSYTGGTEIHQKYHFLPEDEGKKWTVPPVFVFRHSTSRVHLLRNRDQAVKLASVTQTAGRETFTLQVDSVADIEPGQTVMVCAQGVELNNYFLQALTPRDNFTEILKNGVSVSEKHIVRSIEGNRLTFVEPIRADIDPQLVEWTIYDYPTIEGWGVEDLHFSGNCPVPFVHHKNFIHNSGYQGIRMEQGINSWIRRCRFTDMSGAFLASGCLSSSFLLNTIDGNQGHTNFSMNWGGGNLIGLSQDLTDLGSFHGPGISHENVGGVVWRYESVGTTPQTPRYGGPDFHAQFPYSSLWDACRANLIDNGGNYTLLPNHLRDLTFWNFEQIGIKKVNYDFWKQPVSHADFKNLYYGGVKIVYPNLIGFHGVATTFNRKHLGIFESHGKPVDIESLYEAQLALRLGTAPKWIEDTKQEWIKVRAMHKSSAR